MFCFTSGSASAEMTWDHDDPTWDDNDTTAEDVSPSTTREETRIDHEGREVSVTIVEATPLDFYSDYAGQKARSEREPDLPPPHKAARDQEFILTFSLYGNLSAGVSISGQVGFYATVSPYSARTKPLFRLGTFITTPLVENTIASDLSKKQRIGLSAGPAVSVGVGSLENGFLGKSLTPSVAAGKVVVGASDSEDYTGASVAYNAAGAGVGFSVEGGETRSMSEFNSDDIDAFARALERYVWGATADPFE
jgi:hypothetical protein